MDNSRLRHAKGAINRLPCVFARALAHGGAVCELAVRPSGSSGRLQAIHCAQPVARAACAEFDGQVRQKSVFVVRHLAHANPGTTPASLSQIHGGGLRGLRDVLDPEASAPNVAELLGNRPRHFASWQDFPWDIIVRAIAAWRPGR
jgi:hypothetical protein